MRRVYPQVLQSEQAVQELRTEIDEVEAQAAECRGQLNEKTHEIQDLRSSLGAVERQKAIRKESISSSRAQSQKLEAEITEARLKEEHLSEQLQAYFEENQLERQMLDRAANEKGKLLEATQQHELLIHDTMQSAGGVQLQRLGASADLENVDKENDGLQNELASAQFQSMRQRQYLAMEESEASCQYDNTCEAKVANLQSRRQCDDLETCRVSLEARLKELVEAMHEGDALDIELAKAAEHGASLKYSLDEMYRMVRERGEVLEGVSSHHAELRQMLEESQRQADVAQEEANQLAFERDAVQAKCQEEETEFAAAQALMSNAESQFANEEMEAESEVQKAKGSRASAFAKVSKLADTTTNLKDQLKTLEGETKHLQSSIAFFESDTKRLNNENENLEQTIVEVKKKINCVICWFYAMACAWPI